MKIGNESNFKTKTVPDMLVNMQHKHAIVFPLAFIGLELDTDTNM